MPEDLESQVDQNTTEASGDDEKQVLLKTIENLRKERAREVEKHAKRADQLEKQLKAITDAGLDPDQLIKERAALEEQRRKEAEEQATWKQRYDEAQKTLSEKEQQYQREIEQTRIAGALREAFSEVGGRRGTSEHGMTFFDVVMTAIERSPKYRVKLVEGRPHVVEAGSNMSAYNDETGKPFTLPELVAKFRRDPVLAACFEPDHIQGNGSGPSGRRSIGGAPKPPDNLKGGAKIAWARQQQGKK